MLCTFVCCWAFKTYLYNTGCPLSILLHKDSPCLLRGITFVAFTDKLCWPSSKGFWHADAHTFKPPCQCFLFLTWKVRLLNLQHLDWLFGNAKGNQTLKTHRCVVKPTQQALQRVGWAGACHCCSRIQMKGRSAQGDSQCHKDDRGETKHFLLTLCVS